MYGHSKTLEKTQITSRESLIFNDEHCLLTSNGVFITKLCKQQAKIIQHHKNIHVGNIGQGEGRHRKCKKLKLGGGQAYDCLSD
jgi:hypothetical protein